MANEERQLSASGLVVRHVPEPDETYDPSAHDKPDHVTGFVEIGTMIDGVFVILARRKAPGLFADIKRARASRPQQQDDQQQQQDDQQQDDQQQQRPRWPLG